MKDPITHFEERYHTKQNILQQTTNSSIWESDLMQTNFDNGEPPYPISSSRFDAEPPSIEVQAIDTILLMHSDPAGVDLVAAIFEAQGFTTTQLPIMAYVPFLSDLTPYRSVVVWTNFVPADPIATGNVLADYVDLGGSVVMATFSHSEPVSDIKGRFFDDQYSAFIKNGMRDAVRVYDGASIHPIFNGVNSFQSLYPTEPVFLAPGATLVASYTDGVPFVAIKDQVVSMSAWPDPRYWSGDYNLILANAIRYLLPSDVLLLYSDFASTPEIISDLISPFGYSVDQIDVSASTPTLSTINRYKVIISWSSSVPVYNNSAWGDLMASYIDAGGTLIMMPYTYYQDPWSIDGKFIDLKYPPLTHVLNDDLDKIYTGGSSHPVFDGVTGYGTSLAMLTELTSGAKTIATYDDGTIFAALKGPVLAINSYIPSNTNGDIGNLLANAIEFFMSGLYLDVDAPTISSPTDVIMELGSTGQQLNWTVSNSNPSTYELKLQGVTIESGNWTDNQVISVSLDGLVLGNYSFELIVLDLAGNSALDLVNVLVVDTDGPSILGPVDVIMEFGSTGQQLSWIVSNSNPSTYELKLQGDMIESGNWTDNQVISVSLDGFALGNYTFELNVLDLAGNLAIDVVLVRVVDTTVPLIVGPDDVIMELGSFGQELTWTISNSNPDTYVLKLQGVEIDSGAWINNQVISYSLDGMALDDYTFELTVFDLAGNSAIDIVMVQIVDTTKPSILGPEDVQLFDDNITGNITWLLDDLHPSEYRVLQNRTQILAGSWISGDKVVVNLENLTIGLHIFEIIANDGSGNEANDSVTVIVLLKGIPTISNPADINFIKGEVGRKIVWYFDDDDPTFYIVERDIQMMTNASWVALPFIEISLDGYTNGYYNFTLTIYDGSGNFVSDSVFVRIYPRSTSSKAATPPGSGGGNIYLNPTVAAIAAAGFLVFSAGVLILRRRG